MFLSANSNKPVSWCILQRYLHVLLSDMEF